MLYAVLMFADEFLCRGGMNASPERLDESGAGYKPMHSDPECM